MPSGTRACAAAAAVAAAAAAAAAAAEWHRMGLETAWVRERRDRRERGMERRETCEGEGE